MIVTSAAYNGFGLITAVIDRVAMTVPDDMDNAERQAIAAWEAKGNRIGTATPEPQPERTFSWLEFMDLFTESEQAAMAGAAMTDVSIKLWYDRAMGAQGIFLSDPRTIDGVNTMVDSNLLTRERADAVLRGEVP